MISRENLLEFALSVRVGYLSVARGRKLVIRLGGQFQADVFRRLWSRMSDFPQRSAPPGLPAVGRRARVVDAR